MGLTPELHILDLSPTQFLLPFKTWKSKVKPHSCFMNAMSCKTVSPGSVLIRDKAGEKHSFAGNVTTVEIDAVKDDVVLVEGKPSSLLNKRNCVY